MEEIFNLSSVREMLLISINHSLSSRDNMDDKNTRWNEGRLNDTAPEKAESIRLEESEGGRYEKVV